MRVYVTGCAGFIGSHVTELLLEHGHEVHGCDNLLTGSMSNVPPEVRFECADVRDVQPGEFDVVVHLAAIVSVRWPDPMDVWNVNFHGTLNAARFAPRIVLASSAAAASPGVSMYATSKRAAERVCRHGTVLRYANVYGPRQRDWGPEPGVIAAWRAAVSRGEPLRVDGDGTQSRDFIHVTDVARVTVTAVETSVADGLTVDVCTGRQTRIIDLARSFDWPLRFVPRPDSDVAASVQDPTLMRCLFGMEPRIDVM